MKKLVAIMVMAVLCVLTLAGCNSVPKEDYDKLNKELTAVQEENEILKQKEEWLKKYQSVQCGTTKEDIVAVLGQVSGSVTSSNGEYFIEVITWNNNSLFNYEKDDNCIVIGFRNNVVIFKAYGLKPKNIIIDSHRGIIYTEFIEDLQ